tara:strand:- start:528 stop:968 length:441 start_codon:yes stop_codon:yes gene_type:complete
MNKSTIMWIIGGIGTAVGGYFLYKRITRPTETFGEVTDDTKGGSSGSSSSSTSTSTTNNDGLPLKRGSKGEKVKQLQRFLKESGYGYLLGSFGVLNDGVDGDFGRMTEKAVRENQQPFPMFKSMYPSAVEGQVSAEFYNSNIKGQY